MEELQFKYKEEPEFGSYRNQIA